MGARREDASQPHDARAQSEYAVNTMTIVDSPARIIHERCRARVAPPQPERARAKWDPFGLLPQFDELREGPNG